MYYTILSLMNCLNIKAFMNIHVYFSSVTFILYIIPFHQFHLRNSYIIIFSYYKANHIKYSDKLLELLAVSKINV